MYYVSKKLIITKHTKYVIARNIQPEYKLSAYWVVNVDHVIISIPCDLPECHIAARVYHKRTILIE